MKRPDIIEFSLHLEEQYLSDSKSLPLSQLVEFNHTQHLSHFYAYIQEALQELGHSSLAQRGMKSVAQWQRENGSVPGYFDVDWVCSTGLSQLALVWYRLSAEVEVDAASTSEYAARGDAALLYVFSNLQLVSGGFRGSSGRGSTYFPADEISWAVKYALDAILAVPMSHFSQRISVDSFPDAISLSDPRVSVLSEMVSNEVEQKQKDVFRILDVGCGKGRFSRSSQKILAVDFVKTQKQSTVLRSRHRPTSSCHGKDRPPRHSCCSSGHVAAISRKSF